MSYNKDKQEMIKTFFENTRNQYQNPGINGVISSNSFDNRKRMSSWSYCFSLTNKNQYQLASTEVSEIISKVFDNEISSKYHKQFYQAIGGNGNEWKKITTFHSSSLCAFLHFYKTSVNNPIYITIEDVPIEFSEVIFEFENYCVGGRPSSVDVVLISKKNKVILFLESKFSEYLSKQLYTSVNIKYENSYLNMFGKSGSQVTDDLTFDIAPNKNEIRIINHNNIDLYLDGIKQMISHFIGINNFISMKSLNDNSTAKLKECNLTRDIVLYDYTIFLGEVLFDFGLLRKDRNGTFLHNYQREYISLASHLCGFNKRVHFLERVLIYQKDLSINLSNTIKKYYNY